MSTNIIQTSFAAGELAPSIFARTDLAKYHSGAATMRNFFVDYRSGASTRTGTKFVIQAYKSSTAVRLIPFQYSNQTTYVLEFGDGYIRFINNGGSVLEASVAISAITQTLPVVVTAPGHAYSIGDWLFSADIAGMIQMNARFVLIQNIAGNDLTLYDVNGNPIDARTYTARTGGGTVSRVYTLTSPYAAADLALLKYTQSASVMTLTHPSYAPRNLTLVTPTNWTLSAIVFGTTISAPTGLGTATTAAGAAYYAYVVTSIDTNNQESVSSARADIALAVNLGTTAGTITVSWTPAAGASSYNVYKAQVSLAGAPPAGSSFGFVGFTTGASFTDSNDVPDFATTPPIVDNPFAGGNNPGCSCYFQQRQVFAASTTNVETFWMSQPGAFNNFNISDPVQADDAITGTLVSLQVNDIKSMVPMPGGLIMLTGKGAWQVSSGTGQGTTTPVTPINIVAVPQAYNGASDVFPIISNFDVIYVQNKGSIVRDLSYNIYANIYTGNDISILSNHLFYTHQITEWAYAEEPFKIIWCIRDDGILLSLTFVKEQEIYGWARHDTLGLFKSVASVTEGQLDAVYFVVKRYINGIWIQTIERLADRSFPYGAEDAWAVDCGLTSTLPEPVAGLTASSSSGSVLFTADAPVFSSGNVGSILRAGGGIATISAFISPTQVSGTWSLNPSMTLPNDPSETPLPVTSGNWSLSVPSTTFYGADYLNGQLVSINADGSVLVPQVVTNNSITLANPATKVTFGLKYLPQLQTMPLDTGEPTIQGKRKHIPALSIRAKETRGLSAGRTFNTLVPLKELNPNVLLGTPIPLVTADERVIIDPLWDVPGQICIQQDNPLPATILGVIPEIVVGDK